MELAQIDGATASPAFAAFTVETKALADAVAFLAKRVTERRNTIPILSNIAFMVDLPGRVTMTATDLDNFVSVEIAGEVETPGDFTADASALAEIVAKLSKTNKGGRVCFEHGENRLRVYSGRNEYKLPCLPIDDFPAMALSDPTPLAFTVPAGRFLSDLAALAPCISKEESRYYLNGVALQVRDLGGRERFAMIATDGHKIGVASRELPEGAAGLPDLILPRKVAAILGHAAKLSPTCDVLGVEVYQDHGGHKFRFTLGGVAVECKAIDGTFPDWARCWDEQLAPTGEALPMFPELLPAAPLTHMQAIEKAVKAPITWEPARDGMTGTLAGDSDILFAAINPVGMGMEPVKGFKVSYDADQQAAGRYLTALADQRAGRTVTRDKCRLQVRGGEVLGLTVGDWTFEQGRYEERPNWETLHVEKVWIEGRDVYEDGAYSEVMPRDRAKMRPDVTLEIDGDATVYPLGVRSGAIHLTKDQVRAIAGDSVFETMAIEIAGRAVYILRWLWDQGDSRFLTVRPDGRTFKGGAIITRAEIEAAMRGEMAEPVEIPAIASPEPAQSESDPIAAQEGQEPVAAMEGPEPVAVEPSDFSGQLPTAPAHDLEAITARLDALEQALATLSAVSVDDREVTTSPVAVTEVASCDHLPKRTPAHERAIRRAWAERKARRYAQSEAEQAERYARNADARAERVARAHAEQVADLEQRIVDWEALQHRTWTESMGHKVKRRAATLRARRMIGAARSQTRAANALLVRSQTYAEDLRGKLHNAESRATSFASACKSRDAEIAKIKRNMADPNQPERASDIARLVQERDQARTALSAMAARAERAEQGLHSMADRFEGLVSRVTRAEAALRQQNVA